MWVIPGKEQIIDIEEGEESHSSGTEKTFKRIITESFPELENADPNIGGIQNAT